MIVDEDGPREFGDFAICMGRNRAWATSVIAFSATVLRVDRERKRNAAQGEDIKKADRVAFHQMAPHISLGAVLKQRSGLNRKVYESEIDLFTVVRRFPLEPEG